jgi:hypothetical protein
MTDGLGIERLVIERRSDTLFIPLWCLAEDLPSRCGRKGLSMDRKLQAAARRFNGVRELEDMVLKAVNLSHPVSPALDRSARCCLPFDTPMK